MTTLPRCATPRDVLATRRFLAQRHLALLLCVATLLLKLMVPAGYMIGSEHGHMTMELCSGVVAQPAMAMPGMHADTAGQGKSQEHGRSEMPCAFAGLSIAPLGAVDPFQLVALIAFVMAVGRAPTVLPAIIRATHLRPPLRGPPLFL